MMRFWLCAVLPALLMFFATSENWALAQARKPNPAFEKIVDDPKLPRVLIIGDSISMGYTIPVRKLLEGQANVHRIPVNGGPTSRGVESLDAWLGDGKWDVIHFNWGLHDIRYMDDKEFPPGPLAATPAAPRHPQVSIEDYEKNLTQLVERLQKTGAKLIWRNTTPVPEGSVNRVPGDEVRYNAVAEKIMQSHGIQIEDLYSFVKPQISELMMPKNVHYTPAGYDALAEQVAATIKAALPAAQK